MVMTNINRVIISMEVFFLEGFTSDLLTAVLTYWPFLAMALIFYFMLYRPQQNDRKKRESMLNSLKKGDKVITIGGLHGVVAAINKTKVTLIVADNVKMEFELAAVTRFQDSAKQD